MNEANDCFSAYQEQRVRENMEKYGDIINAPHSRHEGHPTMPLSSRAAQFASFAALTGLDDAMDDTAAAHEVRAVQDTEREAYEDL